MEKLHELCYVGWIFVQNRAWNQANIIRYYLFLSTFYHRLNHNVQVTFSLSRYFKRACCRRWRRLSFVLLWHHPIGNLFNVTFCYSKKWCRWRCGKKVREGALGAPTVTGSEKYRMGLKYMAYITNVSLHATVKILNMTASYNGTETVPTEQVSEVRIALRLRTYEKVLLYIRLHTLSVACIWHFYLLDSCSIQ